VRLASGRGSGIDESSEGKSMKAACASSNANSTAEIVAAAIFVFKPNNLGFSQFAFSGCSSI
jgi:hypothetical protein